MTSRFLLAGLSGLALTLLVACGGHKAATTARDPSTPPARSASTNSGEAKPPTDTLNLGQLTEGLSDLKSFRFSASLKMDLGDIAASLSDDEDDLGAALGASFLALFSDIKLEGAVHLPDKSHFKMTFAGETMEYIQVGAKAWMKEGGAWEETEPDPNFAFNADSSPLDMFTSALPDDVLKGAKTSRQRVNGVDTTHYSFDKEALDQLAATVGDSLGSNEEIASANLDIWLTNEGVPVKVVMDVAGKDESGQAISFKLEMNITDINSNIEIKPPV